MYMEKQEFETCYNFLGNVMRNAFSVETTYFSPPYDNEQIEQLYSEARKQVWPNLFNTDARIGPSRQKNQPYLVVIKSNLSIYNMVLYLNMEKEPDFIAIGPFRAENDFLDFKDSILRVYHLSKEKLLKFKKYYETLPSIPLMNIVNTALYIISTVLPEYQNLVPIYVDFTESESFLYDAMKTVKQAAEIDDIETARIGLYQYLQAIQNGDSKTAHNELNYFLTHTNILLYPDLLACKTNLHMINDFCNMSLWGTHVHPEMFTNLYSSIRLKIESLNNSQEIIKMADDICEKYCQLAQNPTFPDYSKIVGSVISYIHRNLEKPLTLSLLAQQFHRNASALSTAFKKDTGITITEYIHQARINKAASYLCTTDKPISDIALAVGYQDLSYFTRLFHKQIKCSPREYRERTRKF